MNKIRLAVVDDSLFVRKALMKMLEEDPYIEVVGAAGSAEELIKNLDLWRPEVVTLDLSMPGMGGLDALDHILTWKKIPIIILSTHSAKDAPVTIEALHRGAVDFIDKQENSILDFSRLRRVFRDRIMQVVQKEPKEITSDALRRAKTSLPVIPQVDLVVLGASTGGPPAIQHLLEDLGSQFHIPMVIVQHMPEGFTRPLAERLNSHLPFPVHEVGDSEILQPGHVYIAPAGKQTKVKRRQSGVIVFQEECEPGTLHCPSIDVLFRSAAKAFGSRALGILLTGMGKDGAKGMLELSDLDAYTIAESEKTCVVYGMPRAAVELGAVNELLPLEEIGLRLREILSDRK